MLPYEADIKPVERFLMERFVLGGLLVKGEPREQGGVLHFLDPELALSNFVPDLRLVSIDIETDGLDGPLLSLAGVIRGLGAS